MRTTGSPSIMQRTSTASRVVPGISLTMTRSEPKRAFTKLDLPAFRRPTIATRSSRVSGSASPSSSAVKRASSLSMRSWRPVPSRAEIGSGSPAPSV